MKIKYIILIIYFFVFALGSFAAESIVSSLIIDNAEEQEIDVVMDKDKMYLPCKYILNYLAIPFKESHAEKSLIFENVVIKNNSIFIDKVNQKQPAFFVKTGVAGLQNEFFISAEELAKITGKNITANSQELLAYLKTKDDVEVVAKNENPFLIQNRVEKTQAYDEVALPIQKGFLSLDTIAFNNNIYSDSYSQIYKDNQSKQCSFNSNIQVTLAGKLNSGDYKLGLGTNSYSKNLFSFSGITPQYKNRFKDFDYLIGKPDDWELPDNSINFDIMGLQLKDHIEKNVSFQDIKGKVASTSTVKVYINDDYEQELSTYGGYYSLKNVYYSKPIEKVRINELLADGTEKQVLKKDYTDENKKMIPKRDIILGISGLQDRLWANNGIIYQTLTKKFVAGFKHHKDISDKLSVDNMLTFDKILPNSENNAWGQNILGNKKYLNYTTMRNLNALEGETYMGVLNYKNNERMNSKLYVGGSNSTSKDGVTTDGLGYFMQYENIYKINNDTSLKGSLFASSPNFYMAGASGGGFMSDRVGASINGNTIYKNLSFSGTYSKYKSNFGDYYEGGLIDFDEYSLNARVRFKKLPNLYLKIQNKKGANGIGEISSNSYELSAEKRIKSSSIKAGIRNNSYSNLYSAEGYSGYTSEYSNIFTDINFPIGKRFGDMTLGHEIVKMSSDGTDNGYNSIKLSYNTPSVKGFNCNFMTGLHYSGTTKGNDYGFGVTKRLKSGSTVSLNYRYTAVPCYIIDSMYIPGSMRHSITVDFAELYGIGNHNLQAIGTNNKDKGLLQVTAFLDTNQNGKKDKGEPMVENVPIKVEGDSELLVTSRKGMTKLKAENEGIHSIQIFEDEMPTLLSYHSKTKPCRYIKIDPNSKTKVSFGLVSTVGNINGSVTIKDEFNNTLRIDDLVVSIIDTTGREVNYTNLNEDGTFSFSGLNPGKYIVSVDKELQDIYRIKPNARSENYVVTIPPEYKDYVNIDNVNLAYKYEI